MCDASRIAARLFKRGAVSDQGGIEHDDVGRGAAPQDAAVNEAQRCGWAACHLVDRLRQRQEAEFACVVTQDTREGTIETRMW